MWLIRFVCLIFALTGSLAGQEMKSTPAVPSVLDYRPIGELRLWTFVSRDSTLGQLTSTIEDDKSVSGREGVVIKQELALDLSKIGGTPLTQTSVERWIALDGSYLGEETEFTTGEQTEELKLELEGSRLEGYFTRAGERIEQSIPWPIDRKVWDPFFVDLLELFVARQELQVGRSFRDSVFSPHTLTYGIIAGEVENFIFTELYRGRFDSVYVIRLSEPQAYTLLMAPDHRLLRVDLPIERVRAYLDRVSRPQAPTATAPVLPENISPILIIMRLAHWLVYLILGIALVLFFVRRQYKPWPNWVGLVAGCIAYVGVIFIQFPLQGWMIQHWLAPRMLAGESVLVLGLAPGILAGLLQEGLKLAALYLIVRRYRPSVDRYPIIGVFVAAGFAITEAFYLTNPGPLIGLALFERAFMLLYHISTGYLVGYLLAWRRGLWIGWVVLVALNSLIRYMPLLVPQRVVSVQALYFVIALIAVAVAMAALLMSRKPLVEDVRPRAGTS